MVQTVAVVVECAVTAQAAAVAAENAAMAQVVVVAER
jgi:hypothetical protein